MSVSFPGEEEGEKRQSNCFTAQNMTSFMHWALPILWEGRRKRKRRRKVDLLNHKYACVCAQLLQLCPTLCDPINCSPPGIFVHGILQARILEQVVISYSRGQNLVRPRDWTCVSCIAGRFFTAESLGKPKPKSHLAKSNKTIDQ